MWRDRLTQPVRYLDLFSIIFNSAGFFWFYFLFFSIEIFPTRQKEPDNSKCVKHGCQAPRARQTEVPLQCHFKSTF